MKVLQIACGVSYTNIYSNLFSSLKEKGIKFEVYVPQHKVNNVPHLTKENFPFDFYSNKVIKPYDKLFYFSKIRRMVKDVRENFKLKDISVVHAHSLFSDGGIAFEIYKKYNIPYIVAVRDTDVNQYFKKAFHLRKYALKILSNASNVIFLSSVYRDYVLKKYVPIKAYKAILDKTKTIPNGIDNYWLTNKNINNINIKDGSINLLFVGQIIKRKNVLKIVEVSNVLKRHGKDVNLTLIGQRKDEEYFNIISSNGTFKHISNLSKEELIKYYRESDVFIMPSITETFGLVYAEAMSQGLPVIYSKGQGFHGQFSEGEVGYAVNPSNTEEIVETIKLIIDNQKVIKQNCIKNVDKFNWDLIAQKYQNLYNKIGVTI